MIASVDGCKAGWLLAMSEGWPCSGLPELRVCPTFRGVLDAAAGCQAVAVDMPIGLPTGRARRACDLAAKEQLGPAVFLAPPRETLAAGSPKEFQALHRAILGCGAGLPVWGIVPKIREVDALVTPALQERVREFHPELVWRRLAGRVLPSKHDACGLFQRMDVLAAQCPDLGGLGKLPAMRGTEADDILDAVVGLAVAHAIAADPAYNRRLPEGEPQRDERGLRMEIWC